jgi:hypothetical protein
LPHAAGESHHLFDDSFICGSGTRHDFTIRVGRDPDSQSSFDPATEVVVSMYEFEQETGAIS